MYVIDLCAMVIKYPLSHPYVYLYTEILYLNTNLYVENNYLLYS